MKINAQTHSEMMDTETQRKASEDARTFAIQTTRAAQEALLLDSHRAVTYLESRFVMSWELAADLPIGAIVAAPGVFVGTGVLGRPAVRLPRREAPDRYRPRDLPDWRVQAFFAAVDRARERKIRGTRPGPLEKFRRMLEETFAGVKRIHRRQVHTCRR